MQIKKEELRESILNSARHEFASHGYEDSSMRMIAKRAHTTIGNIYNYFDSKEALLDALMIPYIKELERFIVLHLELNTQIITIEELNQYIDQAEMNCDDMAPLLKPEFIILVELQSTKYLEYQVTYMKMLHQHLAWHLNTKKNEGYMIEAISKMIIDCFVFLIKRNGEREKIKHDFLVFFKRICSGFIVGNKE